MSARRLGRLVGSLVALAALIVFVFAEPHADHKQVDFEWGMTAASQVSVR
ncbi:hypothetical protein QTQ03_15100 [Micromonospora sp. WMMA1363]|nr:hypothetical protein [Micromonospora sp. WMMA1363]MDM4720853.1 hypothetical protein [Micromonospora sp. WMMA1363]